MKKFALTALLALSFSAMNGALAAGTPAGEQITNAALFEFSDSDGSTASTASAPVVITVAAVYQPVVQENGTVSSPGQTVVAQPGTTATLTYTVINSGNATDTLNLSVTDGNGQPLPGTKIYLDNGDGVFGPGDTEITDLKNLPADGQATVLVRYDVPANGTGGAATLINLTVTSATDPSKVDTNNIGQVTTRNVLLFTLTPDATITTTPGAAVSSDHILTNTGNTTLNAADFVASTATTTPAGQSVTVTYTVTNGGTTVSNTDLQTALRGAGDLEVGLSLTIRATYTPSTSTPNGTQFTNTLTVSSGVTDTTTTDNQRELEQAVSNTDTVNVNRGVASVSKTGENCGTDATCATSVANPTSVKPGEYIRYTVRITNTGSAALAFPTLRDYVPLNTTFYSVSGSTTQANANILHSSNRTAWTAQAPAALATTTDPANGPFTYVGLDSNRDGNVTAADGINPGESLTMSLIVKVK